MQIKVIGSTKVGYELPKDEAILFSGKSAGICYLPDTVEKLMAEPEEKTLRRANSNIELGHHSVFGHVTYNLILEGVPKILAMVLNNEKAYTTSEKSARYTVMQVNAPEKNQSIDESGQKENEEVEKLSVEEVTDEDVATDQDSSDENEVVIPITPKEKELYEKWCKIFQERIKEVYPNFAQRNIEKLAQENARYLISVFTPATTLEYTASFQQLNYIINWAKEYIKRAPDDLFSLKLKKAFQDFLEVFPDLEVEGLNSSMKQRQFSLFATRMRSEEFGENYSTSYYASFAQLAQAQRHRTLSYEMLISDIKKFYIPHIIEQTKWESEWIKDINSLEENFPQGMMVWVNERGTIENFVLKCSERLCGAAQLEIAERTALTLEKYEKAVENKPELANYLKPYTKGARCTFPGWKCTKSCIFGPKYALNRTI